jgi:hypothetical protein
MDHLYDLFNTFKVRGRVCVKQPRRDILRTSLLKYVMD